MKLFLNPITPYIVGVVILIMGLGIGGLYHFKEKLDTALREGRIEIPVDTTKADPVSHTDDNKLQYASN